MTSREIVRRTLEYDHPERVARSFGESDFTSAGCSAKTHATGWKKIDDVRWERTDEWGNLWGRIDATSKGEVLKGVLGDWNDLDNYQLPDYSQIEDFEGVRQQRERYPDKWLIGGMPGFAFNIARKMRKLDQYLMDLHLEPDCARRLHDRIDDALEVMILNYARSGADAVMFPEDWGTQTQTLISPQMWRDEFFPRFQRLCAVAHKRDIAVFMHSCGLITSIVPGLMEAGIDLLQFDQPDLHGIDTLAAHQQRDKITFWCPVDIQTTLQQRDEQLIRAKADEMLDQLWHGRGGFVAGYYGDNISIGLEPIWQEHACDQFMRQGTQSHYGSTK